MDNKSDKAMDISMEIGDRDVKLSDVSDAVVKFTLSGLNDKERKAALEEAQQLLNKELDGESKDASHMIASFVTGIACSSSGRTLSRLYSKAVADLAQQQGTKFLSPYLASWSVSAKRNGSIGSLTSVANWIAPIADAIACCKESLDLDASTVTSLVDALRTLLSSVGITTALEESWRAEFRQNANLSDGQRRTKLHLDVLASKVATILIKTSTTVLPTLMATCKSGSIGAVSQGSRTTAMQNAAVAGVLAYTARYISENANAKSLGGDEKSAKEVIQVIGTQVVSWFQFEICGAKEVSAIPNHTKCVVHFGLGALPADMMCTAPLDVSGTILRSSRRAPVIGLEALSFACMAFLVSPSKKTYITPSFVKELSGLVATETKSPDEARRESAMKALSALGAVLGKKLELTSAFSADEDKATLLSIFTPLTANLVGKGGVVFPASESAKLLAIESFTNFAASFMQMVFSTRITSENAAQCVVGTVQYALNLISEAFVEYLSKDSNASTRNAAFFSLGKSIAPCSIHLDSNLVCGVETIVIPSSVTNTICSEIANAKPDQTPIYTGHGALYAAAIILCNYCGTETSTSAPCARAASELRNLLGEKQLFDRISTVAETSLGAVVMRETALAASAVCLLVKGAKKEKKQDEEKEADVEDNKSEVNEKKKQDGKKKKSSGTVPSFLVDSLSSTTSLVCSPEAIANASDAENDLLLAVLTSLFGRHALTILRANEVAAKHVLEGNNYNEPQIGSSFEGDTLYSFAGAFIAAAQLRVSPDLVRRVNARRALDNPINDRPELVRMLLLATSIIAANTELAIRTDQRVGNIEVKRSDKDSMSLSEYWPLMTKEGNLLVTSTAREKMPTAGNAEDIEPIYVACWDGTEEFLCVRRYDIKTHSRMIQSYKSPDALVTHPTPSSDSQVWASALHSLNAGGDPKAVAYMLLLSANPSFTQGAVNPAKYVELAARKMVLASLDQRDSSAKGSSMLSTLLKHKRCAAIDALISIVFRRTRASNELSSVLRSRKDAESEGLGWLISDSIDRRRAAIVTLTAVAKFSSALFNDYKIGRFLATIASNPESLKLTPYQIAVLNTPSGVLCSVEDPDAEKKQPQIAEDFNAMIKKGATKGKSAEDVRWEMNLKNELKDKHGQPKVSSSAAQLEKEEEIRKEVKAIIQSVDTTLATVTEIAKYSPSTAHSITPTLLPTLQQLIRGAPLGGPDSLCKRQLGTRATVESDSKGDATVAILRKRAIEVTQSLAQTLDLAVSHSPALVDNVALSVVRLWEKSATEEFSLLTNKEALKKAYEDPRTADLVAASLAIAEIADVCVDSPLSAATFSFIMPILDALIRQGPLKSADEIQQDEEDDVTRNDLEDEKTSDESKEEDYVEEEETSANARTSLTGYIRSLWDAVNNAVRSSAVILASHAAPAAASNNRLKRSSSQTESSYPGDLEYPIIPMLSLSVAALNRFPSTFSEERSLLASSLQRLSSTLQITQLDYLIGGFGLFSPISGTAIASLRALERCQTLLARDSLLQSGDIDPSDAPRFADVGVRIWTMAHGANREVALTAQAVIKTLRLEPSELESSKNAVITTGDMFVKLRSFLGDKNEAIRMASAQAMFALLDRVDDVKTTLDQFKELESYFDEKFDYLIPPKSLRDSPTFVSMFEFRHGVAAAFASCVPLITKQPSIMEAILKFALYRGLSDLDNNVWNTSLNAGLKVIHLFGEKYFKELEAQLQRAIKSGVPVPVKGCNNQYASEAKERLREGAFILYGTTGQMAKDFETTSLLIDELVSAVLETKSKSAQDSAAGCLSPLIERLANAPSSVVKSALEADNSKNSGSKSQKSSDISIAMPDEIHPTINRNFSKLLTQSFSNTSTRRNAAATSLAAVVRGVGGRALRLYNLLSVIESKLSQKQESVKHGCALILGELARVVGKALAPYAPTILRMLMPLLGESNSEIRKASRAATGNVMKHLDSTSSQLVLPLIMDSVKAPSWRTRVEAIQIIGSMTRLSGQVQSHIMPKIAPVLFEAVIDIAPEVRAAARETMDVVISAIRSPEIRRIRDLITKAIVDPNSGAPAQALVELSNSTLKHQIDPISVALLMPTLRWGLRSRDPKARKAALQLLGCMSQIVPSIEDIAPYRTLLVRFIKALLMDPTPDVRRIASRALSAVFRSEDGAYVDGTPRGRESISTVLEQLLGILDMADVNIPSTSEHSSLASKGTSEVQRSGAALGAAELMHLMGNEGLKLLEKRIEHRMAHSSPDIREGYLFLMYEMAISYKEKFASLLEIVFPVVLEAIADTAQRCREAAVKLGQHIAITFALSHKEVLLAPLVGALVAPDWRVRQGSAMLMASMLLRTAGLSGYITIAEAEDDIAMQSTQSIYQQRRQHSAISTEAQELLVEEMLTPALRNEVYTSLYIMQTDGIQSVATVASRLWIALVPSENRMMSRILPTLIDRIVQDLASQEPIRQHTAGSSLSRLVSRYLDRVLQAIVPILLEKHTSPDVYHRRGVCFGIGQILTSATRNVLETYLPDFFTTIRAALCDPHAEVREAARSASAALYSLQGSKIIKELIFPMLNHLERTHNRYLDRIAKLRKSGVSEDEIEAEVDESLNVLGGFIELYKLPNFEREVIEMTLKHFIKPPLTAFHVKCLSILTSSQGSFNKFVPIVTEELLNSIRVFYEYKEGDNDLDDSEDENEDDPESHSEGSSEEKKSPVTLTPEQIARREEQKLRAREADVLTSSAEEVMRGLGRVGLEAIINVLVGRLDVGDITIYSSESKVGLRVAACKLIGAAISSSASDDKSEAHSASSEHLRSVFRALVSCLIDDFPSVQNAASEAINFLVSSTPLESLVKHVALIRARFNEITGRDPKTGQRKIKEVPGLGAGCLLSLLTYFQYGLVNSTHTSIRDQSAAALAEIVSLAPASALKPHVVKLTGPLIRSFGDRYSPEVRAQILTTLGILFAKNGASLRAFQPQLQATFWKGLLDPQTSIRTAAVVALPSVIAEARRVDSVIEDFVKMLKDGADTSICSSVAKCLRLTLAKREVATKLSETTLGEVIEIVNSLLQSPVDQQRIEGARLVGSLCRDISEELAAKLAANIIFLGGLSGVSVSLPAWEVRQAVSMSFSCMLIDCPERFMKLVGKKTAVRALSFGFRDENEGSCTAAVRLAGRLLLAANNENDQKLVQLLCQELLVLASTSSVDTVKVTAVEQVCKFAEQDPDSAEESKLIIIPNCIRARTGAAKAIRRVTDTILFYVLGFHESNKVGMVNAEAFASNFSATDAAEFIGLCKRSVADIRPSRESMEQAARESEAPNPEEE